MSLEKTEAEIEAFAAANKNQKISKETKDNIREIKKELKEILKLEKGTTGKELKECIKKAKANLKANTKKLTALRKEGEKKCKKEPKDQRAKCNNKIMAEYNNVLAKIVADNEDELKRCNDKGSSGNSNSIVKKRRERMEILNKEVDSYNEKVGIIKENRLSKKHLKDGVKDLNKKKKDLKDKIRAFKLQLKPKEEAYKQAMSDVKDMLSKKDQLATRKFLKNEYKPLFLEMKELKELRARASKLNTEAQVLKVANGLKQMKNISQKYAIDKYCYGVKKVKKAKAPKSPKSPKAPKGTGAPRKAIGIKKAPKKR
jgi:DNA repair exonuclease SbcCD ATPase subunit